MQLYRGVVAYAANLHHFLLLKLFEVELRRNKGVKEGEDHKWRQIVTEAYRSRLIETDSNRQQNLH